MDSFHIPDGYGGSDKLRKRVAGLEAEVADLKAKNAELLQSIKETYEMWAAFLEGESND